MINVATLKDDFSTLNVSTKKKVYANTGAAKIIPAGIGVSLAFLPTVAFASDGGKAFFRIHSAAMNIFDGATLLIIIFAGGIWMMGHRSRAVEMLLGACCGYLIASHAVDIRDFLKTI